MQFLLQVTGVNIYATVKDTNQLSVQRGSSLLLRQAIKDIETELSLAKSQDIKLKAISTGASAGLFAFEAKTPQEASQIQDEIVRTLNQSEKYKQLTFVIDSVPVTNGNFKQAKEKVLALNRFRQFQQATIVFPVKNEDQRVINPCAWDNLRPADGQEPEIVTRDKSDHGPAIISFSAEVRHKYGRDQKHAFIERETGIKLNSNEGFTNDLQEIATLNSHQSHLQTLENKLAILYFDGNGFGGIQNELEDSGELSKFDRLVQERRKKWLKNLIETIRTDEDFKITIRRKKQTLDAIRLEVLLWGGDEIILAVPAWKGMYVLQHFYQFQRSFPNYNDKTLTHAGGLVFCHVRTPIQRMQELAQEIADHIKDAHLDKIDKYSPDADLYDYVVLESVDYPTQSWKNFLIKKYGVAIEKHWKPQKPLDGNHDNLAIKFNRLKESLPRRQLYRLASALIKNETKFANAYQQFEKVVDDAAKINAIAKQIFPGMDNHLHWLHLVDLWDYFSPQNVQSEVK